MLEMKDSGLLNSQFPPGFRFHPTDQELITHYLKRKVTCSLPPEHAIIADIDLYKYNPWDLPEMSFFGEGEWFFFSPRERKYPNGVRPNRAAASGYWKATGTDKPILAPSGTRCIGVKKALVFYQGRPPKGTKTDWVMQEYRLLDSMAPSRVHTQKDSMRLDDWVLCRVRHRGEASVTNDEVPLIRSPPVSASTNSTQTEEKPLVTETKMRSFNTEYTQQIQSYIPDCPIENMESNNGEDVSSAQHLRWPPLHPAGSCSAYAIAQQQLQAVELAVRPMKRKHALAEMDDMTQQQACKKLQFSADGRLLPLEPSLAEQSCFLDFMYQSSWNQGQRCD